MRTIQNYKLSKTKQVWQTWSYSNATDNFEVKKSARKRAQNLQVTCAEFAMFWRRILTTVVVVVIAAVSVVVVVVVVVAVAVAAAAAAAAEALVHQRCLHFRAL